MMTPRENEEEACNVFPKATGGQEMVVSLPLICYKGHPTTLDHMSQSGLVAFVLYLLWYSPSMDTSVADTIRRVIHQEPDSAHDSLDSDTLTKCGPQRLRQAVRACYAVAGCQLVVTLSAAIERQLQRGRLLLRSNGDGTTSVCERHSHRLVVTFRDDNLEYDRDPVPIWSPRKHLLPQPSPTDVRPPATGCLCDLCGTEFSNPAAAMAHERLCGGPTIESDSDCESVSSEPTGRCFDQTRFLSYLGVVPSAETGRQAYLSPSKRHAVLLRNGRRPGPWPLYCRLRVDFSSVLGCRLKGTAGQLSASDMQSARLERYCWGTSARAAPACDFKVTWSESRQLGASQRTHHYCFAAGRRATRAAFLRAVPGLSAPARALYRQMTPCSVRVRRLGAAELSGFGRLPVVLLHRLTAAQTGSVLAVRTAVNPTNQGLHYKSDLNCNHLPAAEQCWPDTGSGLAPGAVSTGPSRYPAASAGPSRYPAASAGPSRCPAARATSPPAAGNLRTPDRSAGGGGGGGGGGDDRSRVGRRRSTLRHLLLDGRRGLLDAAVSVAAAGGRATPDPDPTPSSRRSLDCGALLTRQPTVVWPDRGRGGDAGAAAPAGRRRRLLSQEDVGGGGAAIPVGGRRRLLSDWDRGGWSGGCTATPVGGRTAPLRRLLSDECKLIRGETFVRLLNRPARTTRSAAGQGPPAGRTIRTARLWVHWPGFSREPAHHTPVKYARPAGQPPSLLPVVRLVRLLDTVTDRAADQVSVRRPPRLAPVANPGHVGGGGRTSSRLRPPGDAAEGRQTTPQPSPADAADGGQTAPRLQRRPSPRDPVGGGQSALRRLPLEDVGDGGHSWPRTLPSLASDSVVTSSGSLPSLRQVTGGSSDCKTARCKVSRIVRRLPFSQNVTQMSSWLRRRSDTPRNKVDGRATVFGENAASVISPRKAVLSSLLV